MSKENLLLFNREFSVLWVNLNIIIEHEADTSYS
jgi:hypothetical protein